MFSPRFLRIFSTPHFLRICYAEIRKKLRRKCGTPQRMRRSEVSDHRAGRVWRSRHRSKTRNCLPGARDQVPVLFRNAIERRGASVDPNSGAPITQSTFDMLRRMANPLSLLNLWLHKYDNEDDYALISSVIVWKMTIYFFHTHVTLQIGTHIKKVLH